LMIVYEELPQEHRVGMPCAMVEEIIQIHLRD
jgi:hypothetical protein